MYGMDMSRLETSMDPIVPSTDDWAAFRAINARRRAVRDFDGSAIDVADVHAVLAEAQLAPSSSNLQPWRFHYISEPPLRRLVAAACHRQRAAASASVLVVLSASSAYARQTLDGLVEYVEHTSALDEQARAYYRKHLQECRWFDRIGGLWLWEPIMDMVSLIEPTLTLLPLGAVRVRHEMARNAMFAAQTLMLAASARGLDSCPMEGFSPRKVARLLKLPRGTVIPLVIALGRRTPDARVEPRWRVPLEQAVVEY